MFANIRGAKGSLFGTVVEYHFGCNFHISATTLQKFFARYSVYALKFSFRLARNLKISHQKRIRRQPLFFYSIISVIFLSLPVVVIAASPPQEKITLDRFTAPHITPSSNEGVFLPAQSFNSDVETLTIPSLSNEYHYYTPEFSADFSFNAVGAVWRGENAAEQAVEIFLITDDEKKRLPPLGDDRKEELSDNSYATSVLVLENSPEIFSFEIVLRRASNGNAPQIEDITFKYFDTTWALNSLDTPNSFQIQNDERPVSDTPTMPVETEVPDNSSKTIQNVTTKTEGVKIIARAEWGADETWRFTSDNTEIWPVTYIDPQIFVIHHTAGTDGGNDPAATIRAIYYWHAVVLGWGDIGYNYLIDPQGNIYEGRYGGEGVVGGHTFNEQTNINYNEGSIGVALLGCYEETEGACSTLYTQTTPMSEALSQLVAAKSNQHNLQPNSEAEFQGSSIKRVVGHRDLDYTYCPGSAVYATLETLRSVIDEKYQQLIARPYKAKLQEWLITNLNNTADQRTVENLRINSRYRATVSYLNEGTETWTKENTYLKIYNASGEKPTSLRNKKWQDIFGRFVLREESVAPGETGSFSFSLRRLTKAGQKNVVTVVKVAETTAVSSRQTSTLTFINPLTGKFTSSTWPIAMKHSWQQEVTVTFTNTGEVNWEDDVVLTADGAVIGRFDQIISPEQSGTITFTLTAPPVPPEGDQVKYYLLKLEKKRGESKGRRFVVGTRKVLITRID